MDPTPKSAELRVESSMGGWLTSTSSRSAKSVNREWEEVGIAWAGVKRGPKANVNSHRVLQRSNSFYEGNHWHPVQPVGDGMAHLVYTGAAVSKGRTPAGRALS